MHEMEFIGEVVDGDEYFCPICFRQLVIDCQTGKKRVIAAGNEMEQHTGGRGGLSITASEIDDPRLEVFEKFLDGLDGDAA